MGSWVRAGGKSMSSKRATRPRPNSPTRKRYDRSRARPDAVRRPADSRRQPITAADVQNSGTRAGVRVDVSVVTSCIVSPECA
ncbi:hypothetical protein FM21_03720 [Streptomyces mutabilis]|uniref:Uncharacterized protein n=1 Tax=Streptomyces mutabilis TaxID=67332 RepID=A0A086N2A1_9ACTN|nr:hypothetical protein FM21_03720 [Streptomyces mutabilis]